jgi:hypothetical protein
LTKTPATQPAPKSQAGQDQKPTATASGVAKKDGISMSGDWQFGFQFNNSTMQSTVHIDQQGTSFSGSGKDDQSGKEFQVLQGQISNNGSHVTFIKKYTSGNSPEIQYIGELEMANDPSYKGPYMSGDYQTIYKGQPVSNRWEAEMIQNPGGSEHATPQPSQAPPVPAPAPSVPAPPPQQENGLLNKTPELSGKWNTGYEYNFKTIHSTMFLEQDGDRITGHGVDHETHEKFVIEKGWYHYPKLTLVRKWPKQAVAAEKGKKGKKGNGASLHGERTMIFKATVSVVNDKDYSGPYLSGKTQGGGAWEAQMYK